MSSTTSRWGKYYDLSDNEDELACSVEDYFEELNYYVHANYGVTGRFDQNPISPQYPPPTLLRRDLIKIFACMGAAVTDNPTLSMSILPDQNGHYAPFGNGKPWCEFENFALAAEMFLKIKEVLIIRGRNERLDLKPELYKARSAIFAQLSSTLNTKYGIDRSANACKNQWYRELRERTGCDERKAFYFSGRAFSPKLSVSLNKPAKRSRSRSSTSTVSPSSSSINNDRNRVTKARVNNVPKKRATSPTPSLAPSWADEGVSCYQLLHPEWSSCYWDIPSLGEYVTPNFGEYVTPNFGAHNISCLREYDFPSLY